MVRVGAFQAFKGKQPYRSGIESRRMVQRHRHSGKAEFRFGHIGNRAKKLGLPPGSLVYLGQHGKDHRAVITVMEYNGDILNERQVNSVAELLPINPAMTTWINVDGVHDEAVLAEFGQAFKLHPLLLEDILNTDQRPKAEFMENLVYVILKMFDFDRMSQRLLPEQVSLVVGPHFLISFLEEQGDEFDLIRERLRGNSSRLRQGGSSYLAYSLIDTVVDRYFLSLEKIGETLESMEESLIQEPPPNILKEVHHIKREMIFLRKYTWPVREVVSALQHADTEILTPQTQVYLRDVYEHTIQVMDTLETYRDLLAGTQDLYLSVLSNRMNEIMKVLTVMSSLFIPLTFIVGLYGMNFKYMPELSMRWGYPAVWLVMLLIVWGMLRFFRRRGWI
jgi:magnesium transporter